MIFDFKFLKLSFDIILGLFRVFFRSLILIGSNLLCFGQTDCTLNFSPSKNLHQSFRFSFVQMPKNYSGNVRIGSVLDLGFPKCFTTHCSYKVFVQKLLYLLKYCTCICCVFILKIHPSDS